MVDNINAVTDPYQTALAADRFSMKLVAEIIGKTLQHNEEAQARADATSFERNIRLVNILL